MRWLLLGIVGVAGLTVLLLLVGLMRPKRHVARCRATLRQSPQQIWEVLADFEKWPQWSPSVKKMERQPDHEGHAMWQNTGSWGPLSMEIAVWDPPRRLETRVDAGSFRGSWTYEVEEAGNGTRVTITEAGEVDNPLFRGLLLFKDNYASAKQFLRALGRRCGEEVEPEALP